MAGDHFTFIISSVIYYPEKKLSYSRVRSYYTPQERSEQTLQTIQSIRQKIPTASIVLVEMGKQQQIDPLLIQAADHYIYTGNNWIVKWARNSRHKGLGEAMGLLAAREKITIAAGTCFKISGRYFLNDDFSLEHWRGNHFFFRKYGEGVSTRLYAFDASLFHVWITALKKSLYQLYKGRSIEDVLPQYIDKNLVNEISLLGVSGFVAPNGEYLSE